VQRTARPGTSDADFPGDLKRVVDLNAKVTCGAFGPHVAESVEVSLAGPDERCRCMTRNRPRGSFCLDVRIMNDLTIFIILAAQETNELRAAYGSGIET
jgi:hypothetical protein